VFRFCSKIILRVGTWICDPLFFIADRIAMFCLVVSRALL
jgi:hypothetical protein